MNNFLQSDKFFATVVTLCAIFIQDTCIKDFFGLNILEKIGFSLKKSMHSFSLFFCFVFIY